MYQYELADPVYLNDEKKSVDPRLHLKRVDSTDRNHCDMTPFFGDFS